MTTLHTHNPNHLSHNSNTTMTCDFMTTSPVGDHTHRLCNITEDEQDEPLSSLPEKFQQDHLISSPRGSPMASPVRQRSHTIDSAVFPRKYRRTRSSPCRIPKDPIQPREGSISDIHTDSQVDDSEEAEEDPFFAELPDFRSRSQTCPESIMRRRREKVRAMHRPSTPPPTDLSVVARTLPEDVDQKIDSLIHMEKR